MPDTGSDSIPARVRSADDLNLSEEEREEKEEDSSFVEGDELDVEELVRNELIVQWPIRVLCKDDM